MKKLSALILLALIFVSCKDTHCAESFYEQALECYAGQKFQECLENIKLCLKSSPDFYQAQFLKAKLLFFMNQNEDSLRIFNKLIKKYPGFTEARIWRIRLLIALAQYDRAEEKIIEELNFNGSDWRVFYQYALLAEKQGLLDKKIAMCSRAEKFLSEGSKVYVESADLWLKLGLKNRALEYLDKAIAVNGANEELQKIKELVKN